MGVDDLFAVRQALRMAYGIARGGRVLFIPRLIDFLL
jgi:hypothetical protein